MQKDKKKSNFAKYLIIFVLAWLCFIIVSGLKFITVDGPSMEPNYPNNSVWVSTKPVWNNEEHLQRGDVIAFDAYDVDPRCKQPGRLYIKRIIGVPGDTVSYEHGTVYINGKPENKVIKQKFKTDQDESQTRPLSDGPTLSDWNLAELSTRKFPNGIHYWNNFSYGKKVVPKNCYFVMGDHRSVSNDSREFGYVPAGSIKGNVHFEI